MITKLKPQTKNFYNLMEMCDEVDNLLGFSQRGCGKVFYPDTGTFDDWHKEKGLPKIDPEGKEKSSSQLWYAEYMKEVKEGKWNETPYLDFWHWQLDNTLPESFRNDSYSQVYVGLDSYIMKDAPDWVVAIQTAWHVLYKDVADKHGDVDVWVSW